MGSDNPIRWAREKRGKLDDMGDAWREWTTKARDVSLPGAAPPPCDARSPAAGEAVSAADAYAGDPVVAAARGLTAAARAYAPVTERTHRDAAQIRTRLEGVTARHSLGRSVLVVDDSPEALLALTDACG